MKGCQLAISPTVAASDALAEDERCCPGRQGRRLPSRRRRTRSAARPRTEQFAGSEAYAALEQLYDLHSRGDYDLIVPSCRCLAR